MNEEKELSIENINNVDKIDIIDMGETFSFRPSLQDKILLFALTQKYKLTKSDIFRLGLYAIIEKINNEFMYKGVNLKEFSKVTEERMLRRMISLESAEKISGDLFIERVKKDIIKYLRYNKSNEEIMKMLDTKKKIAKTYSENHVKEIEKLIEDNTPKTNTQIMWHKLDQEYKNRLRFFDAKLISKK